MRFSMWRILAALLGGLLLASCSKSSEAPTATESAGQVLALDENSGYNALENKYANYGKNLAFDSEGNLNRKDSKRSNFEGRQMSNLGGAIGNREYAATRYSKKNWQGTKNYEPGKFQSSKNRWDNEEYFLRQQAREGGATARVQGKAYDTGNFQTNNAREQSREGITGQSHLATDIRQRVNPKPLIIDDEDYAEMSLEDSNRLLGR